MTWSTNITEAQTGDYVWLALPCGRVRKSFWYYGCFVDTNPSEPPIAWQPYVVPVHPFQESPRNAAEAEAERPAYVGATVAPGLVEADKAEAVVWGLGQPDLILTLTAQNGGVNVSGPEKAGVTAGETAQGFASAKTSEDALTKAPMNVSLPDTDERSGEGANTGGLNDREVKTKNLEHAVEFVSSSTAPELAKQEESASC